MDTPLIKVLFVCTGNICRSPLAHAVFEQEARRRGLVVEAESAGIHRYHIGENADHRTRGVARDHGYPFDHAARQVTSSDIDSYDLVLAMDRSHLRDLLALAGPDRKHKVRLYRFWDPLGGEGAEVPDPYYGDRHDFEEVQTLVERTTQGILDALATGEVP
jgi:protein-tyrosine phosphatase